LQHACTKSYNMKRYKVDILGEEFEVRSNGSAEKVRNIAQYVDEKMQQAVNVGRSTSREKAAILAALNIAEELFNEKDSTEKGKKLLEEKSDKLLELVQKELER